MLSSFYEEAIYFLLAWKFPMMRKPTLPRQEQIQKFELSFWKPPRINQKLQRIFLTGINNFNYQFKQDDKEDETSDDKGGR